MGDDNLLLDPLPWDEPSFLSATQITGIVLPYDEEDIFEEEEEDADGNNDGTATTRQDKSKGNASMKANILCLSKGDDDATEYFFLQRKLNQTGFASVWVGFVVEPEEAEKSEDSSTGREFRVVKSSAALRDENQYMFEMVAIKLFHRENMDLAATVTPTTVTTALPAAMTEMAALETIAKHVNSSSEGSASCHVDSCTSMGCDDHTYYAIVPFHGEGTLFQYVAECGVLAEPIARHYFQQILKGIKTLRDVGLCHRNINLSTIQLRGENCTIAELSSCMKLGEKEKTMFPPHWAQGGNPRFIPPEVVRMENFSGEQADLWASAICLCQMLWGMEAPFVWASPEDPRYTELCINGNSTGGDSTSGGVPRWAKQQRRRSSCSTITTVTSSSKDKNDSTGAAPISEEACDIIQSILRADPKDRFTLEQILQHKWLQGEIVAPQFTSMTHPLNLP